MITRRRLFGHIEFANRRSVFWSRGVDSNRHPMDERALIVFQADILISHQFDAIFKSKASLAPEKSLMFAVLQDAVNCFQDNVKAHDRRKRALFVEAEEWIVSQDVDYLFSFENICAALGLDANCLRQGLLRWKASASGITRARLRAS